MLRLSVLLVSVVTNFFTSASLAQTTPAEQGQRSAKEGARRSSKRVIKRVEQSVVLIRTQNGDPLGSGFIIDSDRGVVVTNLHVIVGQREAIVEFHDGKTAAITGFFDVSRDFDLATLCIASQAKQYPSLKIAERLPEKVDDVLAFGSPLGLKGSVTTGNVSAVRPASDLGLLGGAKLIQHSAPISPGNSGGPLVNREGNVVGVNTMAFKAAQNLNFAVASSHIRDLVRKDVQVARPLSELPQPEKAVAGSTSQPTNPPNPKEMDDDAKLRLVEEHYAAGLMRKALQALDEIPEKNRGHRYWKLRGSAFFLVADFAESVKCFKISVVENPTDADAMIRLATALRAHSLNNQDLILAMCREALRIAPNDARAFHVMGATFTEVDQRIDALKSALSLDESDLGTHYHLGCELVGVNRSEEACKHFEKAIGLIGSAEKFVAISPKPERFDPNETRYTINTYSQRNSLESFLRLHLAAASEGDDSIKLCQQVLRSEPKNAIAKHMIGMTMRGQGVERKNQALIRNGEELQGKDDELGMRNLMSVIALKAGTTGILIFRK